MPTVALQPSPLLFFETINAFQRTEALKTALDLDVFSAVAATDGSVPELAERCGAAERGIRILCDYLVVLGFLEKTDDRYRLTPDSAAFLDRSSPMYVGGATEFLLSPALRDSFSRLTASVRMGGTAMSDAGSTEPEHPMWVSFARSMGPILAPAAAFVAATLGDNLDRPWRVLDISAGHGMFGIAIAQRFPKAEVTALDWAPVLKVAQENAEQAGLNGRYRLLPGNAFEIDWDSDYDAVLLPNFLHHFDAAACERVVRKAHRALNDNGRLFTLEFVPNDDRVSPPGAAAFALTMLATTPAGDAHTLSDYRRIFERGGFPRTEEMTLPSGMHRLLISSKGESR